MESKLNPFRKVFVDDTGTYSGLKWWWRWLNAKRHWYQWLIYEGMPPNITDTKEMHAWNRELIRKQDELKQSIEGGKE